MSLNSFLRKVIYERNELSVDKLDAMESAYILGIAEEGFIKKWKEDRKAKKEARAAAYKEKCEKFESLLNQYLPKIKKIAQSEVNKAKKNPKWKSFNWDANIFTYEENQGVEFFMDIAPFSNEIYYDSPEQECFKVMLDNITKEYDIISKESELTIDVEVVENGVISLHIYF